VNFVVKKAIFMKVKICGMKYPDNILEVSSLLPDYMGFIFWENHRGILMVSSLLYRIDKKVGVLLMKHSIIIQSIKTRFTSCSIARKKKWLLSRIAKPLPKY
jgi:hypothetical protein